MTIPLAPPENSAYSSVDVAELKKANVNAEETTSREHFAEGVNPALETSKWALEVCRLCLVVHTSTP